MKKLLNARVLISSLLMILGLVTDGWAANYYVDFDNGNDANNGLSQQTAWKTIPGTRTTGNTGWQSTAWGSGAISSSNKVPAGTTFILKKGTTSGSLNGQGMIQIDSTYYASNASASNPIKFTVQSDFGTGSAVIDGSGVTVPGGYAMVLIYDTPGVALDGVSQDGIKIQNSGEHGARIYGSSAVADPVWNYVTFFGNNANYASANGVSVAQLRIDYSTGGSISHCIFDGNGFNGNGLFFGESHVWSRNITVSYCEARNIRGTFANSDGVGFKALNSQVTWMSCTAHDNYKGWDLGEDLGDNVAITYKVVSCSAYSNIYGINMNSASASYTGAVNFYIINSLVYDNAIAGSNVYEGPYNIYVVHNVYHNNGSDTSDWGRANIQVGPDAGGDTSRIAVYFYNNAFYRPASQATRNYLMGRWNRTGSGATDFTLYSDFNAWVQTGSEAFVTWGAYAGSDDNSDFSYGANGPGRATGNWYNYYGSSTSPPVKGLGHYHQDSHSKGTGATDTTSPPFRNAAAHDYTLLAHYAGTDLSTQPWYIPEMGSDRAGRPRIGWDIGAYEFQGSGTPPSPPKNLMIR
jgi:hypothetical protein